MRYSETLQNKFDENFNSRLETEEGLISLEQHLNELKNHGISEEFLAHVEELFAGYKIIDIINPKTTEAVINESNRINKLDNKRRPPIYMAADDYGREMVA